MSLPIKDTTEVIGRAVPNRFKGLPSKRQVRVEENGRPFVISSTVYIISELNKIIHILYPEFCANNDIYESSSSKQKEGHPSSRDGEGVQREGVLVVFCFLKRANSQKSNFFCG